MKRAPSADSSQPQSETNSIGRSRDGSVLWEILTWIVIVIAIGLLCFGAAQRLRRAHAPSLTWVAVRSTSTDTEQSYLQIVDLPPAEATDTALTSYTADLTALGPRLDDPSLGQETSDAGTSDAGPTVVPRPRRWRFHFPSGLTEGQYARQLDSLGIELGVLGDDGKIQYVSALGGAESKTRSAPRGDEKRLYLTWNRGDLEKADLAILKNAGISKADQIVLHFCPSETEEKLLKLEQEFKGRKPAEIQFTLFSVKRTFRGYEVYVKEQVLR
jgi:hypothetical protein